MLVLFDERGLNFNGSRLLLLRLLLISNHALQLLVRLCVFGLQLGAFDGKALPELLDLRDGITELVETDVKMTLLFFQLITFLIVKPNIMVDTKERKLAPIEIVGSKHGRTSRDSGEA